MPQQENQRYYQPYESQVELKKSSVASAWCSALSETCKVFQPLVTSATFVPLSSAIVAAFLLRNDVRNDSSFSYIPFMLICGGAALIGKFVPFILIPTTGMYLWIKNTKA